MKSQRGFSLLEFLLVLLIATALTLGVLRFAHYYRWQSQAVQIQQHLERIIFASVEYFYQNCQTTNFNQQEISLEDFKLTGIEFAEIDLKNAWGSDFKIIIDNSESQKIATITINSDFNALPDKKSYDYYRKRFAASGEDEHFIWRVTPFALQAMTQSLGTQLQTTWLPLELTKRQNTSLWMLKNTLQVFTRNYNDASNGQNQSCIL